MPRLCDVIFVSCVEPPKVKFSTLAKIAECDFFPTGVADSEDFFRPTAAKKVRVGGKVTVRIRPMYARE